ncbi:MAG TPA: class I SAM-dependent methyltransferase [Gammaproteobacteria bacterium]|nr:class I SAM-dependent methyltransferase [Gammaproteobacteria bacterium]
MAAQNPTVWLKPGREKSLRRRHPWVFSGAVGRADGDPEPGATVELVGSSGEFLARGAWSPASQIRARVWSFETSEAIDGAFFRRRLARAVESRRRLELLDAQGACRLVFSESDGLPGLIVDRYGEFLVCQFSSAGAEAWRSTIVELLVELCSPRGIYERSEGGARHKEGLPSRRGLLAGKEPPAELTIVAGGVRLVVDIANGQKTGAYLDQQRNREHVAAHARDSDVLDAFSYTGGFAIACLKAGARRATLIDSSPDAMKLAEREAASNDVLDRCGFVVANVFDELRVVRDAGARFDLVVLDPPKFVHSADQVTAGSRGYKDINMLGLKLVRPGGVLATFSCSGHVDAALFQKIVAGAAVDAGRTAQIVERLSQPPDHPVATEFPEADYLKGLILRVH